mgnify:CR=1 FL=1
MKRKSKIILILLSLQKNYMKNLILLPLFWALSFSAFSQDNKFRIGIESGANVGFYLSPNYTKYMPKFGVLIGGTVQYNINKNLSLKSGLSYEKIGFYSIVDITGQGGNSLGTAKFNHDLYYYRLPLLLRANFGNKTKFFVNAGVNFSTLSKAHYYANTDIIQRDMTMKGNFKINTFGFISGAGASTSLSEKINTSAEIQYNYTPNNINVLSFILGVGYKF